MRSAWLLALLGSACVAPVQPDDSSSKAAPVVVEEPGPPPVADAALPECPPDADADTYCTPSGELAGRWVMVDRLRVPASAETIFEAQHPEITEQPSLRVAIDGDTLYIAHVTCGACRRVMGNGFSGDPAALDPEQRRAIQDKLGLGDDVAALDGVEAWRKWAAGADGQAALAELAKRGDPRAARP